MLGLVHRILYALLSGVSEMLPLSASGHQYVYRLLSGRQMDAHLYMLAIHLGCFAALYSVCGKLLKRMRTEKRLDKATRRRHLRAPDRAVLMNMRIVNTAVIPLLLSLAGCRLLPQIWTHPLLVALFLLLYAALLLLPRFLQSANKDGNSFTLLDGLLMGLAGALAIFPGFGRFGCMYSVAKMRGAKQKYAVDMSALMCLPALGLMIIFDIMDLWGGNTTPDLVGLLGFILSMVMAFFGVRISAVIMNRVTGRMPVVGFAYYNLGLSFFIFLLYLIIP